MRYLDWFKLNGKFAVVTGGSRGLGRSMSLALGEAGATVIVTSRNKSLIKKTSDDIIDNGGNSIYFPLDITDKKNVDEMLDTVRAKYGRIDILINNAGITADSRSVHTSPEEWDNIMNTNLRSVFLLTQVVGEIMIEQQVGKIINIGSTLGLRARTSSA